MPIYEYTCKSCGKAFETLVRTGAVPACPVCASADLERMLSLPAVHSESTHGMAMRAAKKRDAKQADINTRTRVEYEASHDD